MGIILRTFDENAYYTNTATESEINLNSFNIKKIPENFIISQNKNGEVVSRYCDDIWDLSPYKMNPSQYPVLHFKKRIQDENHIVEAKRLILLLLLFGAGKNGSKFSAASIQKYLDHVIVPITNFALAKKTSISQLLSDNKKLLEYITSDQLYTKNRIMNLSALLTLLDRLDNKISGIEFKREKKIFDILLYKRRDHERKTKQTLLIPSRILSETLKKRWEQIDEIEEAIENIVSFLDNYLGNELFAASCRVKQANNWTRNKNVIPWSDAVKQYQLDDFFTKYGIRNRQFFRKLFLKIQGTCAHLIHAYSGMRAGEVLNLKTSCIKIVNTTTGITHIISTTSKLEGANKPASWVTSNEIQRVINILRQINFVIAKHHNLDVDCLPLFIKSSTFEVASKIHIGEIENLYLNVLRQEDQLPLDKSTLLLTADDMNELNEIDYNRNTEDLNVGEPWVFTWHQYRRSLAVYSIRSGLVSLGVLQIQLKHLFREMTLYYGNGASYAKKLFDMPKEHIANDIDMLKPEVEALVYIKEVIFADEQLFGVHGTFIEKNLKIDIAGQQTYLLENREKTIKQFKNGEIAYKETAIGGCVSLEACDYALTRSIVACPGCDSGIIKKSKLNNVIDEQKEFIKLLDKDSIEYRTEMRDLEELEKQRRIFLGSKA